MLTILSRIPSDIINYVGANELLLLSVVLRVQGENKIYFFEGFMGKRKHLAVCAPFSPVPPPPPTSTVDLDKDSGS